MDELRVELLLRENQRSHNYVIVLKAENVGILGKTCQSVRQADFGMIRIKFADRCDFHCLRNVLANNRGTVNLNSRIGNHATLIITLSIT